MAAFMDFALYDSRVRLLRPRGPAFRPRGRFFTSVDVGSLFGELLEVQLAEMHQILQTSDFRFQILTSVEAGAGNGRLSADILRAREAAMTRLSTNPSACIWSKRARPHAALRPRRLAKSPSG